MTGHFVGDAELVVDPGLAALGQRPLEIRDRLARAVERHQLAPEAAQGIDVAGLDAQHRAVGIGGGAVILDRGRRPGETEGGPNLIGREIMCPAVHADGGGKIASRGRGMADTRQRARQAGIRSRRAGRLASIRGSRGIRRGLRRHAEHTGATTGERQQGDCGNEGTRAAEWRHDGPSIN